MAKVRKLLPSQPSGSNYCLELPSKRRKTDYCTDELNDNEIEKEKIWVSLDKFVLTLKDKDYIESGDKLNDKHINFVQLLLKQFQYIGGLISTLTLCRSDKLLQSQNAFQIVHDRGDHWIVASSVGLDGQPSIGEVRIYDSIFTNIHGATRNLLLKLFGPQASLKLIDCQQQEGGKDCGVFAIAV